MQAPADNTTSSEMQSRADRGSETASTSVNVNKAERGASIAAGAALVLLGLRRSGLSRIVLSGAGTLILFRGVSGRCPAYRALGLTSVPSEAEDADVGGFVLPRPVEPVEPMVIEEAMTIRGSAEELRETLRELPKLSAVLGDKVEIGETTGGDLEWHVDLPFERTIRFKTRWTETDAPNTVAWETLPNEWIRSSGSLRFEAAPANAGTSAKLRLELEALGAMAAINLGSKLIEPLARKLARRALGRFKSLVETGEVPTNAMRTPASSEESR